MPWPVSGVLCHSDYGGTLGPLTIRTWFEVDCLSRCGDDKGILLLPIPQTSIVARPVLRVLGCRASGSAGSAPVFSDGLS